MILEEEPPRENHLPGVCLWGRQVPTGFSCLNQILGSTHPGVCCSSIYTLTGKRKIGFPPPPPHTAGVGLGLAGQAAPPPPQLARRGGRYSISPTPPHASYVMSDVVCFVCLIYFFRSGELVAGMFTSNPPQHFAKCSPCFPTPDLPGFPWPFSRQSTHAHLYTLLERMPTPN